MLWLAVAFPDLGLAVHTRALPPGSAPRPLALVYEGRVLACNAEAAEAGVRRGQRTAGALALCPPLRFLDYLPAQEAQLLRQLAESCIAVTPAVVLAPPHALLLEVGGCLRLFSGHAGVLKQLRRSLKPHQANYVLAQAPTPKAALALVASEQAAASLLVCGSDFSPTAAPHTDAPVPCRSDAAQRNPGTDGEMSKGRSRIPAAPASGLRGMGGRRAEPAQRFPPPAHAIDAYLPLLCEVPVTALPWTAALQKKLESLHLHTLGELLALPRASLSKRLGTAAMRYLAQLEGTLPDPQAPITIAEDFQATLFFLDGISHVEGLRFPMKRLLDDLCRFLRQRQLACARFTWRFAHFDKSRQQLAIASARGEPQAARFMQLTELKLEHFRISAPVEAITLEAREFQPQGDTSLSLLPEPGEDDEKALALLDRLRARLGIDACQLVLPGDVHTPEAEQQLGTGGESKPKIGMVDGFRRSGFTPDLRRAALLDGIASPLQRPFWLWPQPKALRVVDGTLWWQGAFTLLSRPERIALPWWEDGDTRDYYLARHENGGHYWVFFSRAMREWFCHGVFG